MRSWLERARALLAGLVLLVALRLGYALFVVPDEIYSVSREFLL